MSLLPNIIFAIIFFSGLGFFARNIRKLRRNIYLGKDVDTSGDTKLRWTNMAKIALGQGKMTRRPISGFLHIVVYLGFVIINIEVLEIVIDGFLGTHRIFSNIGPIYGVLIGTFEVLAFLVFISVVIFWFRRNTVNIKRFMSSELNGWPKLDGNLILYFEIVLMALFIIMNATDVEFQSSNNGNIISQFFAPIFEGLNVNLIERIAWWMHIVGIIIFLNYLYYSKHLHILLAFPNTYFGSVKPKGFLNNIESITNEVKLMMDPEADPYASDSTDTLAPDKFGASDVLDLNWVQLLNAYTCTECGRCTSECPANQTGKKLSPRKIMMDTRDRLVEVGNNIDSNNGEFKLDGIQLLGDYITNEEIWACTSCNACVEACPISIDPLSIILEMRRYLVMEQSAAPMELNNMMSNIENNGAPWPYSQMDRLNWKN
ncbi:MAG: (Fe-S)-binding protein [Formosa sp.]|jgi:heterodisulfide reductase subunit C|nr:(Fe-S)-binding protein [Formosa sp.]MDA9640346.1 (Fe-S)-binding protein [Flavobacteriaceae bacterium]|tara:strand:- start:3043 stop:4332 length:1290 start_codon:yes stop_codon:yes gene_type:complete